MNTTTENKVPLDSRAVLMELWQAHVGSVPMSDNDDFFAAGGESMSAIRLLVATTRRFGIDFDVDAFFAEPTFGSLLTLVDSTLRTRAACTSATATTGLSSPSPYQSETRNRQS